MHDWGDVNRSPLQLHLRVEWHSMTTCTCQRAANLAQSGTQPLLHVCMARHKGPRGPQCLNAQSPAHQQGAPTMAATVKPHIVGVMLHSRTQARHTASTWSSTQFSPPRTLRSQCSPTNSLPLSHSSEQCHRCYGSTLHGLAQTHSVVSCNSGSTTHLTSRCTHGAQDARSLASPLQQPPLTLHTPGPAHVASPCSQAVADASC